MNMKECSKCGKKDSLEEGYLMCSGLPQRFVIFKPKQKNFFHGSQTTRSFVCKNCGYIETYIDPNPFEKTLKD